MEALSKEYLVDWRIEMMKAEEIFGQCEDTLVWSCLQGIMGEVFLNEKADAAMAILGDFTFFAGKPDEKLVRFKPESCKQELCEEYI